MGKFCYTINDRLLLENQLLIYFKEKKNVVFLNSNDTEKTNLFAISNTNDVDICLTGPILDWDILYKLMYEGMDLALNKHQIFVDIKHYDNINFFDYPREDGFKRLHIMTQLSGIEEKEMNGVTTRITTHKTNIPGIKYIPKNLAVNLTEFPLDKQIIDKRIYKPLLIN